MSGFESIRQGLNEAIAFAGGQTSGARVHQVEVQNVDVALIRASTGLSQSAFAKSIGVAQAGRGTLGPSSLGNQGFRHRSASACTPWRVCETRDPEGRC